MGSDKSKVHMNFAVEPASAEALAFNASLAKVLWVSRGVRSSMSVNFSLATGMIVGELLRSASLDRTAYLFRSMSKDTFKGEPIGHHLFKAVTDAMDATGFLVRDKGHRGGKYRGRATSFRATPKLISSAEDHGIRLYEWHRHYRWLPRPPAVSDPLILKSSSTIDKGKKLKGGRIPVDMSRSPASRLGQQVNELNAFFQPVLIEPDGAHYAFRRVFNQGDVPGFNWNRGGRLISVGRSYQQMKQAERKAIKLNGERTVEVDIRASHLTILHAQLGIPFDASSVDPYEVPGIPRHVVKGWVTMTLGHDRFQRCWSRANKEKYQASGLGTGDLQKDYPIAAVRKKITDHLSVLKDWPSCPVRWGRLQYLESCAVVGAVEELATQHSVPALPVHDSIIVPVSAEELACKALEESFELSIGVKPALSKK